MHHYWAQTANKLNQKRCHKIVASVPCNYVLFWHYVDTAPYFGVKCFKNTRMHFKVKHAKHANFSIIIKDTAVITTKFCTRPPNTLCSLSQKSTTLPS